MWTVTPSVRGFAPLPPARASRVASARGAARWIPRTLQGVHKQEETRGASRAGTLDGTSHQTVNVDTWYHGEAPLEVRHARRDARHERPTGAASPMTAPSESGLSLENAARQTWAALLTLDGSCRIVDANPAAAALARLTREGLLGRRFCEAFRAVACGGETGQSCVFARALQGRERRTTPRWTTCTSDGESYTVLLSAASQPPAADARGLRPLGAVVTMISSTLVDDADRRRRELIATALHELRHTASVQSVAVDMLAEEYAGGMLQDAGRLIDTLREATASLCTSLDDILNRTLFELDALRLNARSTEIFPLLDHVAARLGPVLRRRRQEIMLSVPMACMPGSTQRPSSTRWSIC